MLGRLAVRLDPATEQPRREALLDEAIAMARAVGDRAALARLLALSPLVNWRPESSARREADAAEVLELAAAGGDREAALWARIVLHADRFADGDIAGADRELAAYDRLAGELGRRYYRWYGKVLARDARDLRRPPRSRARRSPPRRWPTTASTRRTPSRNGSSSSCCWPGIDGRPDDVPLDGLREFAARYPGMPVWRALLAMGEWVAGNATRRGRRARSARPAARRRCPPTSDLPCTLALLADVSASVGELRSRGASCASGSSRTRRATS